MHFSLAIAEDKSQSDCVLRGCISVCQLICGAAISSVSMLTNAWEE